MSTESLDLDALEALLRVPSDTNHLKAYRALPALIAEVRRLRDALQRLGNYEAFAQTYLGGYQTSEEIETFQHGMSTVCSAARAELEAAKRSFAGDSPDRKGET